MASSKERKNNGPHIFWRNGRAYADFRSHSDVGGEAESAGRAGQEVGHPRTRRSPRVEVGSEAPHSGLSLLRR